MIFSRNVLLIFLIFTLNLTTSLAQTCDCNFINLGQRVTLPSSDWVNCFGYVRLYLERNIHDVFIPNAAELAQLARTYRMAPISNAPGMDRLNSSLDSDSDFIEVCDAKDAQVVTYSSDHAAIILSNTCLISKNNELINVHGVTGYTQSSNIRFFKYSRRSAYNNNLVLCPSSVRTSLSSFPPFIRSSSCTPIKLLSQYSNTEFFSYNRVYSSVTYLRLPFEGATTFQVSKISGSPTSTITCSDNRCSLFQISLNTGASIDIKIKQVGCPNPTERIVTFYRAGGTNSWRVSQNSQSTMTPSTSTKTTDNDGEIISTEPIENFNSLQIEDFSVFPNPSNGIINLKTALIESYASITNLLGQEMYRSDILSANDVHKLNMLELKNGIYLLNVKDVKGRILYTEKIVIQIP